MSTKHVLFALRIAMGWLFFYAGISKILSLNWSAASYLRTAKTFPGFFDLLLDPSVLPFVNFLNKWGLTLIGISLIVGLFVRWSAIAGIALMILYYLPVLDFPKVGDNSYVVDEHVIYIVVLALLWSAHAGRVWGIDAWFKKK